MNFNVLKHFDFPDHHRYVENDLLEIENFCKMQPHPCSIITTEKDMVKLIEPDVRLRIVRSPWFYLPIKHVFLQNGLKFDEIVFRSVLSAAGSK